MSSVTEEQKTDDPDAITHETDISHSRSPNKRSSRKVAPHIKENNDFEIFVEIKPKRILRIVHLHRNHRTDTRKDNIPEIGMDDIISKEYQDEKWIHQSKNSFKFQTNVQINRNPSTCKELSPADTTMTHINAIDDFSVRTSPQKSPQSVKRTSGIENEGYDDSSDNVQRQDYSENCAKTDVDNQFLNSSPSQEIDQVEAKNTGVLERSATTRSVDIEFEDSSFAADESYSNNNGKSALKSQHRKVQIQTNTLSTRSQAVLFFIHGVGGSVDVWKQQLDYFSSEGYEIVCPDLIGHGFSAAPHNPKNYKFEEISTDLLLLFDMFCKKQNVVIGHSYGCSFAAVLARERPSKVNKMILISGGSPIPLAPQTGIFSLPTCCLACIRPVISRGFRK